MAEFEPAFLPMYNDDSIRLQEPCVAPNARQWRFEVEADCEAWFHAEISNIVLSAWANYPTILQSSHNKPLSEVNTTETVDVMYSMKYGNAKLPLVIGEFKRNLIHPVQWQSGETPSSSQKKLSRELRGYAHKYQCPHVFCFDGETLLLQFRASKMENLEDEECPVDFWVLPRTNSSCTLRYALYRLLVQGLRRCQGYLGGELTIGNLTTNSRQFYSGRPTWKINGKKELQHPQGFERSIDASTGSFV
ncbi:hypothetical protein BDY21DRAFT_39767 [Lineolata rhizophorae]|uniref:Uncharacterized protein n=1 Tax=Lineolata rhizophorae TaxID=578093 RepID=A0A6A6NY36_9PEZI|nr:hypothetical protein BDY21DRAFT_39767 [Lineolata rhizophorae]